MGVTVSSYQPPKVAFTKNDAKFHLFATTKFSVKDKELFTFKFVSIMFHECYNTPFVIFTFFAISQGFIGFGLESFRSFLDKYITFFSFSV